ncbi:MAG: hypothetical protein ACKOAH_22605, partial [Pirellula sp.]
MDTAQSAYESKTKELDGRIGIGESLSKKLSIGRIATAIPGLVLVIVGLSEPKLPSIVWIFGLLLIVGFLALASWQEVLRDQLDWAIQKRSFYRRMLARCRRQWDQLPALPTEIAATEFSSELSKDLD